MAIGNEKGSHQRCRSNAETDGHLLRRARNRTRTARLFLGHVRVRQRVHARILQRREKPIAEQFCHDASNASQFLHGIHRGFLSLAR